MMSYTAEQTSRNKQFLGVSDAPAPVVASEVRVFKSEEDYKRRKVAKILDKDGNEICQKI